MRKISEQKGLTVFVMFGVLVMGGMWLTQGVPWGIKKAAAQGPSGTQDKRGSPPEFKSIDLDADTRKFPRGYEKPTSGPRPGPPQDPPGLAKKHPQKSPSPPPRPQKPAPPAQAQGDGKPKMIPNQVIVTFKTKEGFDRDQGKRKDGEVRKGNRSRRTKLLKVPNVEAAITALKKNKDIESAEPNWIMDLHYSPNDTLYPYQWHLKPWSTHKGSNLTRAWERIKSSGLGIALVDTGLDYYHHDLYGKAVAGYNFMENNHLWYDCNGHGTAVAGVAAAITNNSRDLAGADMGAKLYIAKVTASCYGWSTTYVMGEAIYWASQWPKVSVINMSMGGPGPYSSHLCNAIAVARANNKVVVVTAGNQGTTEKEMQARCPGVLVVGASSTNGRRAWFSNYGQSMVLAPGTGILAPKAYQTGGGVGWFAGTSFSAPLVAGIVALTRARHPTWSEGTIRYRLRWASYNPERGCWNCWSSNMGYGVVDAYWATY